MRWLVNKTGCCVTASNVDKVVLINSSDAAGPIGKNHYISFQNATVIMPTYESAAIS